MNVKEIIKQVEDTHLYEDGLSTILKDEIIQKLREFDELKRVIHDTVDPLIELYSFLFRITTESDDSEGSFENMEE